MAPRVVSWSGLVSFFVCRSGERQRSSKVLAKVLSALDCRHRCQALPATDIIPLPAKFKFVEAQLPFGELLDLGFRVYARGLFNLPYPIQSRCQLCYPPFIAQSRLLFSSSDYGGCSVVFSLRGTLCNREYREEIFFILAWTIHNHIRALPEAFREM